MTKNKLLSVVDESEEMTGLLQKRHGAIITCGCGYRANIGGIERQRQLRAILKDVSRDHKYHRGFSTNQTLSAAELEHFAITPITTRATLTSSTYSDISGASIPSTNFLAGRKYLVLVTADVDGDSVSQDFKMKAVHGSTDFAQSEQSLEPETGSSNKLQYTWWDVWTAIYGEDVKLQFKHDSGTGTVGADQITMVAIKLSDDLIENTDWFYNSNTANTTLGTSDSSSNNASVTITPGSTSDWLVLTLSRIQPGSTTVTHGSRLVRSGEASTNLPLFQYFGEDTTANRYIFGNVRVFSCTAGQSNTFTEKSFSGAASTGTRNHSQVFALNLNKLRNHASAYTEAGVDLGTTAWGNNVQTLNIQPDVQGDVFVLGSFNYDAEALGVYCSARLQIDNNDNPETQFSDAYQRNECWGASDELPWQRMTVANLDRTSHTIDIDAHTETATAGRAAKQRTVVAFTFELPSGVVNVAVDGSGSYTSLATALSDKGANRKYVLAPGKYSEYNIDASYDNIAIEGSGIENTILEIPSAQTGSVQLIKFLGTQDTSYSISSVTKQDTQITLSTAGNEKNFAVGDDIFITDNTNLDSDDTGTDGYGGEWHVVTALDTANHKLTLETPARHSYTSTPTVRRWNMKKNLILRNLTLKSAASSSTINKGQVQFKFCKNVKIENCHFDSLHHTEVETHGVVNGKITDCSFLKSKVVSTPRYGLGITGATTHLLVQNCFFYDHRHAITLGVSGNDSGDRGQPEYIHVRNCVAHMASTAHFDIHYGCGYTRFDNCVAVGYDTADSDYPAGFSFRSPAECYDCHVSFARRGFHLHSKSTANSTNSPGGSGTRLMNCTVTDIKRTASDSNSGHAVYGANDCDSVVINGLIVKNLAGCAVAMQSGGASSDWVVRNVHADTTNTDSGSNGATILINGDNCTFENLTLLTNSHSEGLPINITSGSDNNIVRNVYISGYTNSSDITVTGSGSRIENIKGMTKPVKNAGSTLFSGGSTGPYNIPHGLLSTPTLVSVTASSADAKGDFYISSITSTNIVITYGTAPPSGVNNVTLTWVASVYEV